MTVRYSNKLEDWPSIIYLVSLDLRPYLLHMAEAIDQIPDGWKQFEALVHWQPTQPMNLTDIPVIAEVQRLTAEDLHSGGSFGDCIRYMVQLTELGWEGFVQRHDNEMPPQWGFYTSSWNYIFIFEI